MMRSRTGLISWSRLWQMSGGDGVVLAIKFLEPMSVGILSERRETRPYGLLGGGPGEPGVNRLLCGGNETNLPSHAHNLVEAGDIVIVESPGGGGYGR